MNWDKVKEIVGQSAPLLGTLIGGPAGATVGALIASKLGTANEPNAVMAAMSDPSTATKLKELEYENEQQLRELTFKTLDVELKDKQSARDAHKHSKMPAILTSVMTLLMLALGWLLFSTTIPEANKDITFMFIGQAVTLWGSSVVYWVGTTRSSAEKNRWTSNKLLT